MKLLLKIITLATALHMSCARAETLSLPFVAGPDVYEIYTDASMLYTRVFVNEVELKLFNAGGSGIRVHNNIRLQGPIGGTTARVINAYLKPGKNIIRVEYSSPLLQSVKDDTAKRAFIFQEMYSHTVLSRGRLHDGSSGLSSYELDEAIKLNEYKAEIIVNRLKRRFNENKLKQANFSYELQLPENTQFVQADLSECNLNVDIEDGDISGSLSLNGSNLITIENNAQTTLADWHELLKNKSNLFQLTVEKVTSKADIVTKFHLKCDMKRAGEESGVFKQPSIYLGYSFNKIKIPLGEIKIEKTGDYSSEFTLLF